MNSKIFSIVLFLFLLSSISFSQTQSIFIYDPTGQAYTELRANLPYFFDGDVVDIDSLTSEMLNHDAGFIHLPGNYPFSNYESDRLIEYLSAGKSLVVYAYSLPGLYQRTFWDTMGVTDAFYLLSIVEVDSVIGVENTFTEGIVINDNFINQDIPVFIGDMDSVLAAVIWDGNGRYTAIYESNNPVFTGLIDLHNYAPHPKLLKKVLIKLGLDVIPVELTSFTGKAEDNQVTLEWQTASELNNNGFEIQKCQTSEVKHETLWKVIGFVKGEGTTIEKQDYTFIDTPTETGKYSYRLKQVDYEGTFEYSEIVEVDFNGSFSFVLEQNYPNPFNPATKISWQSPVNGHQSLKVYDVLGNEVATLVDEYKPAGSYEAEFNASDLSNGVYFYKLKAGDFVQARKMILMK